jgi:hypothetical protein
VSLNNSIGGSMNSSIDSSLGGSIISQESKNITETGRQLKKIETQLNFITTYLGNINSIQFMIKGDLASIWQIILILNSFLHIQMSFDILSKENNSLESLQIRLGVATLISWMSLNDYLTYYRDYAFIPNTMIQSSIAVANGLIGVFPVFAGLAILTNMYLYSYFRFETISATFFTMFYNMFGDTVFDTFYGAYQISPLFTIFWGMTWIWFSSNVIINITLAQVEHGFLE